MLSVSSTSVTDPYYCIHHNKLSSWSSSVGLFWAQEPRTQASLTVLRSICNNIEIFWSSANFRISRVVEQKGGVGGNGGLVGQSCVPLYYNFLSRWYHGSASVVTTVVAIVSCPVNSDIRSWSLIIWSSIV